jgi:hypothetical protein
MDLTLTRFQADAYGIFSLCESINALGGADKLIMATLEHSFAIYAADGKTIKGYAPVIPDGEYICKRGAHRLHGMTEDFETFEVMGVAGHTGLLFHWGNYNNDSEGCILTGHKYAVINGFEMITGSQNMFALFMRYQSGVDTFKLSVRSK